MDTAQIADEKSGQKYQEHIAARPSKWLLFLENPKMVFFPHGHWMIAWAGSTGVLDCVIRTSPHLKGKLQATGHHWTSVIAVIMPVVIDVRAHFPNTLPSFPTVREQLRNEAEDARMGQTSSVLASSP